MILEKSHGKEKRYAARDISEAVLQRGTVPGASAGGAGMFISNVGAVTETAVQRTIPVCPILSG